MRNRYFKWLGVKNLGWQRIIMLLQTIGLIGCISRGIYLRIAFPYAYDYGVWVLTILVMTALYVIAPIAIPIKLIRWIADGFKKG